VEDSAIWIDRTMNLYTDYKLSNLYKLTNSYKFDSLKS